MLEQLRYVGVAACRRLRSNYRQTLVFAAIGTATERLTEVPQWFDRVERDGWSVFLAAFLRETVACALAALIVCFALRLCTEKGADLIRRPAKFLLMLTLGTAVATLLAWWLHLMLSSGRSAGFTDRPEQLVNFWLQSLLWGGLIGWVYLLSLQRAEDHARFTALLGKQALLARQLAQSRLRAVRAQVDPAMVARVLSEVHRRYRDAPASASALLDRLISYLRLALNRGQSNRPGLAGDIALIRALVALREAEHGMVVELDVLLRDASAHARSGPLFLTVSALLDEAIGAGARAVKLTLAAWDDHVGVALATGTISITPVRTVALADAVAKLLPAGKSGLQRIVNAGANEYVVEHVCH